LNIERNRIQELELENSALVMRRKAAEGQLSSLSATYDEMLESRQEALSQNELLNKELLSLKNENRLLRKQTAVNATALNLDELRDRVLAKLKVGRQSAAGKAIDAFIKELKRQ
jgi:hypothetical protein